MPGGPGLGEQLPAPCVLLSSQLSAPGTPPQARQQHGVLEKKSQSHSKAAVCPPTPLLTHNISPLPPPVAPQTRLAAPRLGADLLSHPPCGHITPTHSLPGLKMTLNDKTHSLQGLPISSLVPSICLLQDAWDFTYCSPVKLCSLPCRKRGGKQPLLPPLVF